MDELKPCPFCGGKMKVVNFMPHRPDGYWQGMCYKCGIKTKCIQTPEEAITALNRRPAPENKPRLLDTIHDLRNENARLRTEIERMRNTAPENKPLTLEQLRQMDGEPIWFDWNDIGWAKVVMIDGHPRIAAVVNHGAFGYQCHLYTPTDIDGNSHAYARKPEREEK